MNNIIKYPGQKRTIARWIISHFPSDYQTMTYLEPFFGSGSVFFFKARSNIETINDLDSDVFNLFLQIRENPEKLVSKLESTPWSREDYMLAHKDCGDSIEKARRFLVRSWFSIGSGARGVKGSGMRFSIKSVTGGFSSFYEKLPHTIHKATLRLKHIPGHIVQIENTDALKLMDKYNRDNVLMYLDPPYLLQTRAKRKQYRHEMNDEAHIALLEKAVSSKAKIIISGYNNDLYQKYLKGWNVDTTIVFDESGNKRTEYLWYNYDTIQYDLFEKGKIA